MESTQYKLLYVDGLNFADSFYQRDGSFWKLEQAKGLLDEFVEAAHNSGWHLTVFIDSGMSTLEAR